MASDLKVVYDDDAIVVVVKPPGMLSQADRTGDPDVLAVSRDWLAAQRGASPDAFLGLVHRLDRPASGLMVLARTPSAARHLSRQFRERSVTKRYLVLVEGRVEGLGTHADFVRKQGRTMEVVPPSEPEGQHAVLGWQSLAAGPVSLLQVRLQSGRRHQIRVQLAHHGHPILGDLRYGASRKLDGRNLALHAYHLAVEHPTSERVMRWTAAPPSSWAPVLTAAHHAALDRLLRAT